MPKFTLIAEHTDIYGKPTNHKVTHEFTVDTLDNVLENFDLFIRGCGFMPPPGTLDYIEDDFSMDPDSVCHSEFYFDAERNK